MGGARRRVLLTIAACTGLYVGWERWKQSQAAPAVSQEAAPAGAPPAAQASKPSEAAPEEPDVKAPQPAAEAGAAGGAGAPVRVIVRATELSWVGVWQGRKFLFGDLMRPGEVRGFGGDDVLRLKIGNAGGVLIEWNGREVAPFGPRGQVRTVEFRRDGYEVIQPVKPVTESFEPPDGSQP